MYVALNFSVLCYHTEFLKLWTSARKYVPNSIRTGCSCCFFSGYSIHLWFFAPIRAVIGKNLLRYFIHMIGLSLSLQASPCSLDVNR